MSHRDLARFSPAACLAIMGAVVFAGCTSHKVEVEPIKVEPIHMTLDVNLRVDRQLEDFFQFEEEVEAQLPGPPPRGGQTAGDMPPPPPPPPAGSGVNP